MLLERDLNVWSCLGLALSEALGNFGRFHRALLRTNDFSVNLQFLLAIQCLNCAWIEDLRGGGGGC